MDVQGQSFVPGYRLTPQPTVRSAAVILGALIVVLVPVHAVTVNDSAAGTMVLLAIITAAVLFTCAGLLMRPRQHGLRALTVIVAAAPLAMVVAHFWLTGSVVEAPLLMLGIVAVGALLNAGIDAAALIGVSLGSWMVAAVLFQPAGWVHSAAQFLVAVALAWFLFQARRRTEGQLLGANARMSEQVDNAERSAQALAQSEKRFRRVFSDSPVGMAISDEQGCLVHVNASFCRLLGRTERSILGHSANEFTYAEDLDLTDPAARLGSTPEGTVRTEKRYVRPSGEIRWAWLTTSRTPGPRGESWTLTHVQDVTERKAAELIVIESERNLSAVAAVTKRIQAGQDARVTIVDEVMSLTNANSVMLFEPSGEEVVVTKSAGPDAVGTTLELDTQSATAEVFRTGERLFIPAAENHPMVSQRLRDRFRAESLLLQPVKQDGDTVAVLAVAWQRAQEELSDRVAHAVEMLADETAVAITQESMRNELEMWARTDQLTGLMNRRGAHERVADIFMRSHLTNTPVTAALVDLDHFKKFNDEYGHSAGDAHLRAFATAALGKLRGPDLVARWGGEEFLVVLPDCGVAESELVLNRIRGAVPVPWTCSIGWAQWDGTETLDELLERVDEALYAAKAAGRDQIKPAS